MNHSLTNLSLMFGLLGTFQHFANTSNAEKHDIKHMCFHMAKVCKGYFPEMGLLVAWSNSGFSSLLSRVRPFEIPWTAAPQASLSITNSGSLLKIMSIKSVMPFNHLILCRPLLLQPSSFSASGSLPMSQFFASGGQRIGVSASASVLQWIFKPDFL